MISVNQKMLELVPYWNLVEFYVKAGSSWKLLSEEPLGKRNILLSITILWFKSTIVKQQEASDSKTGTQRRFMKDKNIFQDYLEFLESAKVVMWVALQKSQIYRHHGRLNISLTIECTTQVDQANSLLCLTTVPGSKKSPSTRNWYPSKTWKIR